MRDWRSNTNNPPPPIRPEVIQIDIDFDGTIVWNGTVVSGIPQLESFFLAERTKDPQPEIHLRPDRRSRYETTALVMAAAQRKGMRKMGFVRTLFESLETLFFIYRKRVIFAQILCFSCQTMIENIAINHFKSIRIDG